MEEEIARRNAQPLISQDDLEKSAYPTLLSPVRPSAPLAEPAAYPILSDSPVQSQDGSHTNQTAGSRPVPSLSHNQ